VSLPYVTVINVYISIIHYIVDINIPLGILIRPHMRVLSALGGFLTVNPPSRRSGTTPQTDPPLPAVDGAQRPAFGCILR
jgi:hypothetical protein